LNPGVRFTTVEPNPFPGTAQFTLIVTVAVYGGAGHGGTPGGNARNTTVGTVNVPPPVSSTTGGAAFVNATVYPHRGGGGVPPQAITGGVCDTISDAAAIESVAARVPRARAPARANRAIVLNNINNLPAPEQNRRGSE